MIQPTFVNSLGMPFLEVPETNVLLCRWPTRIKDWEAAGFPYHGPKTFSDEGPEHPVGNVSWYDANAWCASLSRLEGRQYRLPTDHEWSCMVGIGELEDPRATPEIKDSKIADVFPWGNAWPPPVGSANVQGEEWQGNAWARRALIREYIHYQPGLTEHKLLQKFNDENLGYIRGYRDEHLFTSPVGSYTPSALGFCDLAGNVSEWCEDRFSPTDSDCRRVLRGGSFGKWQPWQLLSSRRARHYGERRYASHGFRIALQP